MKLTSIEYVVYTAAAILFALCVALFCAGCVSAPPGARAGWSISLVSVQLGGSQTSVDIQNNLMGTNITQRHKTPIEADLDGAISVPLQSLKDNFTPEGKP